MRSGWVGGEVTDEKGVQENGGSGPPDPPPPSGHVYECTTVFYFSTYHNINSQVIHFMFRVYLCHWNVIIGCQICACLLFFN